MAKEHLHFVTGRLAEFSLRSVVAEVAAKQGFAYSVEVLNITVAALMTCPWIAARIHPPLETSKVILPGYCSGDLAVVAEATGLPVERGPHDLRRLAEFFGGRPAPSDYGRFDIEILAEINHAPRWSLAAILGEADRLAASGADVIDLGCNPGETWASAGDTVRALVDAGHRVSIDSLNPVEIAAAARAGCELVLSVNSTNRDAAVDWGCEVVAIPDVPDGLIGLEDTIEFLASRGVPLRIDPVLEPIGFGYARSLGRYLDVRERFPDAEIMMGIGNLTELTDADSAAINVLLLGFCQELGIRSVLTTQVIPWARTSVQECDLARRLVYHSVHARQLPKHLEPRLVLLRDPAVTKQGAAALDHLASQIKDHNYRIFAEDEMVHLISAGLHLHDSDPFALFAQLLEQAPKNLDPGHAFYLGYEMAKAHTALTLGKDYRQDEALDWGFLTQVERHHRLQRERPSKHTSAVTASQTGPSNEPGPSL